MSDVISMSKKDNKLVVVKSVPVSFDLTVEYLKQQREDILKQKAEQIAQRNAELAEIDSYLSECEKLGIEEKPKDK